MKGAAGQVAEEEQLFRRIRESVAGQMCYRADGGRVVFFQAAFNDPQREPSVDRPRLRGNPNATRLSQDDGIVTLRASAIRRLGPIAKLTERGKPAKDTQGVLIQYSVEVLSDPYYGNCAHALIAMSPATAGAGTFKRLKDGLARLATEAGWTIEPKNALTTSKEHPLKDVVRCIMNRLAGRL
jgi:hypothetical protein